MGLTVFFYAKNTIAVGKGGNNETEKTVRLQSCYDE
jgi:hypothetical protein